MTSIALVVSLAALLAGSAPAAEVSDVLRLRAFAAESPGGVELRIFLPEGVDPGSVRIELAGRRITVVARDAEGRRLRSRPLEVEERVSEEGADAAYEGEGWLTITLRTEKGSRRR